MEAYDPNYLDTFKFKASLGNQARLCFKIKMRERQIVVGTE